MSEKEKKEEIVSEGNASDLSQVGYFGDGRSNPAATRPPVGELSDPALPGEPTSGNEELYERHGREGEGETADESEDNSRL